MMADPMPERAVQGWRLVRELWLYWHDRQMEALDLGDDQLYQVATQKLEALEAEERAFRIAQGLRILESKPLPFRLPWQSEAAAHEPPH